MVVDRMQEEWVNFVYMICVLMTACNLMFAVREYEKPRRND